MNYEFLRFLPVSRFEHRFWQWLIARRQAAYRLGIGPTTDANSALPAAMPDTAGGALPLGTLICLRRNTDIMGVVQQPSEYTGPGEVCVKWDDREDLYNIAASELKEL